MPLGSNSLLRNTVSLCCAHIVINNVSRCSAFVRPIQHNGAGVFVSFPRVSSTFEGKQEGLLVTAKKTIAPLKISNRDINDVILSELNSNQRNAVTSPTTGITRVVAGPGAGKNGRK
jgi:hypothetical protein